jgi:tripartite-type tricarboxylate transporter receptor subunit TctC
MSKHIVRPLAAFAALALLAGCGDNGAAADEDAQESGFTDGESVTIVVPTAPGGGFDTEARLLEPALQEALQEETGTNVKVRVENAPGGDGRIGAQRVYESSADNNLVWYYFTNTLVGSQLEDGDRATYKAEEFVPLAVWGYGPSAFVLPEEIEGLEERSIEGLSARSEEKPLLIGGVGLDRELANMKLLLEEEDLPFNYEIVEGSGTSDTVSFLLRGDIEVGYTTGSGLRPFVEEEKSLEFLVSTACETDPAIPDVPTIVDAGWPNAEGICETQSVPRVFLGGPEMPQAKADQLSAAFMSVLEDPEFQAQAEEAERYIQPGGPEEAEDAVQSKIDIFTQYADALGF